MAASLKPVTIRLFEDELELARKKAKALGVSVGFYLRMLLYQNLRNAPDPLEVRQRRAEAIRQFGEVMSAELDTQSVTTDDAVRLVKEARKRLAGGQRANPKSC